MLFRRETLDGILRGDVTLAFRRWKRPTVRAGGRVRTVAGVVRIGAIEIIAAGALTEKDARTSGFANLAALQKMLGPEDGDPVYRIELTGIEPDERVAKRESAEPSEAEWRDFEARFARWEKSAPGYFPAILRLISERPAVSAAMLAAALDVEKLKFKQDVRKLKELGLTESLEVGYRLSARGEVVFRRMGQGSLMNLRVLRCPPLACRPSPPQGGRLAASTWTFLRQPSRLAEAVTQPISPLEGEMAGRPEGGAKERNLLARAFHP